MPVYDVKYSVTLSGSTSLAVDSAEEARTEVENLDGTMLWRRATDVDVTIEEPVERIQDIAT